MPETKTSKPPQPIIKPGPRCPDFASIVKESSADQPLFEQVANCYSKRLEDFAVYYCKDSHLGKDAFQEAMITAMTKLDTYRGDSTIESWLKRIVTRSCSRLRRGKKNDPSIHTSYDNDAQHNEFVDNSPNQEWALRMARGFSQVAEEIEKLEEPDRSLLMARDMMEESVVDLAERFKLTENAVKSRLKRSRAFVREALLRAENDVA